jgi:outer membrane protein TolC
MLKASDTTVSDFSPGDSPLTLAECIRIALEQNPQTRHSWEAIRAAAARAGEERSGYLPSLEVDMQAAHGKSVSLESDAERDAHDTYAAGIDLSYLLLDGGARRATVRSSDAALLEAGFRHNTTLQDIALSVEESYYSLLGAQWLQKVADDTVKRTEYQLELALARHKAGAATRADALRAKTQRAEAELLRVQARNRTQIAHGRLAHNMGLPVYTPFKIHKLRAEVQLEELPRIEQLLDEAARRRPELRAALAHIEAKRSELAIARSASWPTLSIRAAAGLKDTELPPERDEWSVGLSVSYTLSDGMERSYQRRRADAELSRAIAAHTAVLRGVELEVWTAYWRLVEAGEAVEAASAVTVSANESARLAEGEYKNGLISIVGLIDAQTTQTEAERRLVQSRLDWYAAKAQFERVVGRTLAQGKPGSQKEGD